MSDGAAFASAWTRSPEGLLLHARIYGRDQTAGLPVVCLPGLTRNSAEFHLFASALLDRDPARRVVAVDYRGRGRSDHDPDPARYTVAVETADLVRLLDELGIAAAAFIGVSRGGLIAMGLGASRPDLVRAIVLSDIGPVLEREGLLRIKGYVGRFGAPADLAEAAGQLRARFGAHFPALDDADWRSWAETVWFARDDGLAPAYDPELARALDAVDGSSPLPDLWPVFDALAGMPLMVLRGAHSDLLSAATVAEMARRHPGLDAVEIAGEGHTPLLHRPALVARIAAFLSRADEAAARVRQPG